MKKTILVVAAFFAVLLCSAGDTMAHDFLEPDSGCLLPIRLAAVDTVPDNSGPINLDTLTITTSFLGADLATVVGAMPDEMRGRPLIQRFLNQVAKQYPDSSARKSFIITRNSLAVVEEFYTFMGNQKEKHMRDINDRMKKKLQDDYKNSPAVLGRLAPIEKKTAAERQQFLERGESILKTIRE